ncbi:xanthine dehydrogenase family protein molybdopterin-binding subunit [Amycolatopsis jejuensis]|uniref:xanthine dehydrogenase family protein molybdopterin-binding subunit n=1 Tax=Amycolatopsis jejuensis TaxID=330084 RepID=UPI000B25CBD3|nr:xanthine dehydrogenase family protein molybdopterin-binding subunit [Amycolatopsis jejuensis]
MPEPEPRTSVGQSIRRKEDDRLIRGEGVFVDDVKRHGMGYVHFVRSPYAHARIVSVDVAKAAALKGVYGTLTGEEVATLSNPFAQSAPGAANTITDYCLAVGKVRWAGEPVAAVVAATRELARDAADLVEVEYESLEPVLDARRAVAETATLLHEQVGSNVIFSGLFDYGDIEAAIAAADHVVRIPELYFHRFSSTPLECSGAVAEWDRASGEFTVVSNMHSPGPNATWMSIALGVPTSQLRLVSRDIGGGFGNKGALYPYLTAACLLARKLRRPVKWTEWRTDQHIGNVHGSDRWFEDIVVPVRRDGTILGFSVTAIDDCGAFPRYEPAGAVLWSQVTPGCYRWRDIRVNFTQVATNKPPSGANRGYSRMQHLWLIERIIDIVAHELGLDPIEIRKRNYITAEEMPYETPSGGIYDSGDYSRCLDRVLELIDYPEARKRRGEHDGKLIGIGIGSTLDSGTQNYAQIRMANPYAPVSGNNQVAVIKLDLTGEVVLSLGTAPQGQGHETTAAQVAADILGISPDDITVHQGHDSRRNSHAGWSATVASQFAVTGLGATKGAAERLSLEIRQLAAAVLEADLDDIVLENGNAGVKGVPDRQRSFGELSALVNSDTVAYPSDLDVTLNCRYVYRPPFTMPDAERRFGNIALTYATQIHACVVEIDRETGELSIERYAVVDDCGVRINPRIVEGQVHGALAHGLGGSLTESYEFDEDGQPLNANFFDYHVPTALDMPDLRTDAIESPSPVAPLDAKGMGEGGGGAFHAISAAVEDALRAAGIERHVGHSHHNTERLWRLIHDPESGARAEVETR